MHAGQDEPARSRHDGRLEGPCRPDGALRHLQGAHRAQTAALRHLRYQRSRRGPSASLSSRLLTPRADHAAPPQSSLQVFCRNYKQAPIAQTHGLLRKARRLDKILNAAIGSGDTSPAPSVDGDSNGNGNGNGSGNGGGTNGAQAGADPHCYRCQTEFSPFFHEVTNTPQGGAKSWLCHKCHAETRKSYPVIIGLGAA